MADQVTAQTKDSHPAEQHESHFPSGLNSQSALSSAYSAQHHLSAPARVASTFPRPPLDFSPLAPASGLRQLSTEAPLPVLSISQQQFAALLETSLTSCFISAVNHCCPHLSRLHSGSEEPPPATQDLPALDRVRHSPVHVACGRYSAGFRMALCAAVRPPYFPLSRNSKVDFRD